MHIILLFPLLLLYSIHYLITLLIIIIGLILGFIFIRPKRGGFPEKKSFEYYGAVVCGGSVYVSCLVYYLFSLLDINLINII